REANVHRLAEVSTAIIDQCVAQGVPFAREYGGMLDNRSFGGTQVQRTFYARGQTGQQLLLGAYSALERQVAAGRVKQYSRHELLDIVIADGRARGIIARNLVTGEIERHGAHAVLLCTGGYGNVFFLSTNAMGSNVTAIWKAHKRGAWFGNPCYTQIHPTCIPVHGEAQSKLTLMSESLRNDGRIWVPKQQGDKRRASDIPEAERDYYLERRYPAFGNLVPRDVASRAAKERCDAGYGVGHSGMAVYLDFADAIKRMGEAQVSAKYSNLFEMYEKITGENPYKVPMRIYPAVHYTMGGLWVSYELQTTVRGLFALGEANFSDHGANRLGASALMQGLADGYFVIPYTLGNYLADDIQSGKLDTNRREFAEAEAAVKDRIAQVMNIGGTIPVDKFHRELGKVMWDKCGMGRNAQGLEQAVGEIRGIREDFWKRARVPGNANEFNVELEKALRIADFLELGELMCIDARHRNESCGGHFREEFQTEDGEALRDDPNYSYVAAWQYAGPGEAPVLHKEALNYQNIKVQARSYK
ncbi:MAG TPA: fumarate reductase/succinate dehydrogenase flavoprotein subunit, partial [Polyangiaceae bacterium]|nr:fumarate reductase/succinate dehydrogenase flavoprotein subunit [Polyangiaceae bacterium]